jgi:hypothetical protein
MSAAPRSIPQKTHNRDSDDGYCVGRLWNELWTGRARSPGPKDLSTANELVRDFGRQRAERLLVHLVAATRRGWPKCATLTGALAYLGAAVAALEHEETRAARLERERLDAERREQERREDQRRREEESRERDGFLAVYRGLPAEVRADIEHAVRAKVGGVFARPGGFMFQTHLLQEMQRRFNAALAQESRP